ncbi:MAG: biopolymer transporter ExbD [Desulfobacterales bacterium]|nr:biopolymer transporter ExbD [Desulfobacterales bacterium]
MEGIRNLRKGRSGAPEINMAPLLDMVFILLIFFLVTTSFVKEAGVDVERPVAKSAETKAATNMVIGIDKDGGVYMQGKRVDVRSVQPRMKQYVMETPKGSVVIAADKQSTTNTLIQVLDGCRLAGVKNISIAARKPKS